MITLRGAYKSIPTPHGRRYVLSGVDATFPRGRSVAVFGARDSGTKTLLKLLAGADVLDEGTIGIHVPVSWPMGYGAGVSGSMSGRDAAMFVARLYGENPRRVVRFVQDFADVGSLFDKTLTKCPPDIRARIHLALSLSIDFECYLLDGLSWRGGVEFRRKCWDRLVEKQDQGADLIIATPQPRGVAAYCDMGAVLDNGALTVYDDIGEAMDVFTALGHGPRPRKRKAERRVP